MNDFVLVSELEIGETVDITTRTSHFAGFEVESINPRFITGFVKEANHKRRHLIPLKIIAYIERRSN